MQFITSVDLIRKTIHLSLENVFRKNNIFLRFSRNSNIKIIVPFKGNYSDRYHLGDTMSNDAVKVMAVSSWVLCQTIYVTRTICQSTDWLRVGVENEFESRQQNEILIIV